MFFVSMLSGCYRDDAMIYVVASTGFCLHQKCQVLAALRAHAHIFGIFCVDWHLLTSITEYVPPSDCATLRHRSMRSDSGSGWSL